MASISILTPQDGEQLKLGTTTMRIIEDGSTTNGRLGLAVSTLAPHTAGPPQHRHSSHDEGFYVLSGTARFTVGDDVHQAPAGSLVMVAPGVPHAFDNPGDEPMVMMSTFSPAFYVQYFRDLAALMDTDEAISPDAMTQLMARYRTQPRADSPEHG